MFRGRFKALWIREMLNMIWMIALRVWVVLPAQCQCLRLAKPSEE